MITTRRNQRLLRTSTGDSVRNRDYWTINQITPDGDLAVTRIDGHGTTTLPPNYVTEHVQLGYAATEPGNQSDTATTSITLATGATTCRGLYVAVTRGQRRQPDLRRHRHPRHHRRHRRPRTDPRHRPRRPPRHPHPTRTRRHHPTHTQHCSPGVRSPTGSTTSTTTPDTNSPTPRADAAAQQQRDSNSNTASTNSPEQLAELEPHCAPHDHAIAHSHRRSPPRPTTTPSSRTRTRQHRTTPPPHRTTHRRRSPPTTSPPPTLHSTRSPDAPNHSSTSETNSAPNATDSNTTSPPTNNSPDNSTATTTGSSTPNTDLDALDTWADWANGHTPRPAALINAAHHLHHTGGHHTLLANPLNTWIHQHDLAPQRPAAPAPSGRSNTSLASNRPDSRSGSSTGVALGGFRLSFRQILISSPAIPH